jgi:hypothetical protein
VKLDNVRRDDWILAGLALLLVIDLLFLPWFSITVGFITFDSTATGSPDGWLGVLAVIALLALIADLAIEQLSPATQVPAVGGGRASTRLVLVGAAALFVALKFLFHIHFSLFGFGFWAAVVLTAALVFFALQAHQAAVGGLARPGAGAGAAGAGAARGAGAGGAGGVGAPGAGGGSPGAAPGAAPSPGGPGGAPSPGGAPEPPARPGEAGTGPGSVGPPGSSGPPPA